MGGERGQRNLDRRHGNLERICTGAESGDRFRVERDRETTLPCRHGIPFRLQSAAPVEQKPARPLDIVVGVGFTPELDAKIDTTAAKLNGELALIRWMLGINLTVTVGILIRLFFFRL